MPSKPSKTPVPDPRADADWCKRSTAMAYTEGMKTRTAMLRGGVRLASDGFLGVLDTVQGMHLAISDSVTRQVPGARVVDRATRWIYAGIRGIGRAAGAAADGAIGWIERRQDDDALPLSNEQWNWLSALNGAAGDRLEASGNPLAIPMALCRDGEAWAVDDPRIALSLAGHGLLIVLVHGLGMNDRQWRGDRAADFGDLLEHEFGGLALRLRYNSGRAIERNGEDFADLIASLDAAQPGRIRKIVLIGHSMGGLVCRAASASAAKRELGWTRQLSDVVSLGSPHFGAPLERAGNSLRALLASSPYTQALADLAEKRSDGVKDLRHGLQRETEPDTALSHVRWYLGAGVLGPHARSTRSRLLGDGLVPARSALALGQIPWQPAASRRTFHRLGHLDLISHPSVHAQLRHWLAHHND